ncbi:MAG: DNA gyrase inhibitor YacG [Planctomycetota bacterium]
MSAPRRARCPTCKKAVDADPEKRPADFPFCSERCRLLDLGKWLRGEYGIPANAPSATQEPGDR